jgi:hypothetical protein
MSADLARALIAALDDEALDHLARLLAPRLTASTRTPSSMLDVAAAATEAGVSPRTIRRALAAGVLDGTRVAGRWEVTVGALAAWRAAGARRPPHSRPGPHGRRERLEGRRPRLPRSVGGSRVAATTEWPRRCVNTPGPGAQVEALERKPHATRPTSGGVGPYPRAPAGRHDHQGAPHADHDPRRPFTCDNCGATDLVTLTSPPTTRRPSSSATHTPSPGT